MYRLVPDRVAGWLFAGVAVVVAAGLAVGLLRGDHPGTVVVIVLVAMIVVFAAFAAGLLGTRLGPTPVIGVVAVALLLIGLMCLLAPQDLVVSPNAVRGPRTTTAARVVGAVLMVLGLAMAGYVAHEVGARKDSDPPE